VLAHTDTAMEVGVVHAHNESSKYACSSLPYSPSRARGTCMHIAASARAYPRAVCVQDRGHMHIVMRACVCLTGRMHVRIPPAVHACAHPSHRPTPITHEADEGIFTVRWTRTHARVCVCVAT
jgi:hypothetical protein